MSNKVIAYIATFIILILFCNLNLAFSGFCLGLIGMPAWLGWIWLAMSLGGIWDFSKQCGCLIHHVLNKREEAKAWKGTTSVSQWENHKDYGAWAKFTKFARNQWAKRTN